MIEDFQSEVLQEADNRYDEFLARLLKTCVGTGLFSQEEERELKTLLLTRGGLPRLSTMKKKVFEADDPNLEELYLRFLKLRSTCGLTQTGGGVHAMRDLSDREKAQTFKELSEVMRGLRKRFGTIPNYFYLQRKRRIPAFTPLWDWN